MRLLFIIPDVAKAGGVEKVVTQLSGYLQQTEKFQVTILNCVPLTGDIFYPVHPNVAIESLNYADYPKGIFSKIKWYGKLAKAIDQYLLHQTFDVVLGEGGYVAASLSRCKNKNVIKVGCDHVSFTAGHFLHHLVRKMLFKKLDALVVLTKENYRYYHRFVKNVHIIPNFVTPVPEPNKNDRRKIVMASGRLVHQKGFDLLITAFKGVYERFPDWKLEIYGEGTDREKLENLRDGLGLENAVALPGETQNLGGHFQNAAIFVLSSRFEGFPLVLLEAMSFGLCCVSFANGGADELLEHGVNGLLVQKNSPEKMTEAICAMIKERSTREKMGLAAAVTARNYELSNVGKQWTTFLNQLTKKAHGI